MIPAPRTARPWRRRLAAAFSEQVALKASAVLLAVALWLVVAAREPTQDVVSVRFVPVLDSALVLRDPPPLVRALVIGRANEIRKLASTPLTIRRTIAGDAPDTLVVSLRSSDVQVPDGVELIVSDVQPQSLTLRFEPTSSRTVMVRSAVVVRAPANVQAVARIQPESVTVLGPRRTVARLSFIRTAPDSIGLDTLPHLVDLDTTGLGVTVRPPQVKVYVQAVRGIR